MFKSLTCDPDIQSAKRNAIKFAKTYGGLIVALGVVTYVAIQAVNKPIVFEIYSDVA